MRRTLVLALAVVLLVSVTGMPLSARQPVRGDQTMVLNGDLDSPDLGKYGCPEISWFGSIEIDDTTYGMALYPLPSGSVSGGGTVFHYEESWKVWSEEFSLSGGLLEDCTPGDVLLGGTDSGVWTAKTGKFRSNGIVEEAYEPFEDWLFRQVHQDGVIEIDLIDFGPLEGVTGFYGDLRLN